MRVQEDDFDVGVELARLRLSRPEVGAIASFIGVVRDMNDASDVASLTLEHYPVMTERAIEAICHDACARWSLGDVIVVHRIGRLVPTDQIVLVATSSAHRAEALAACAFVMDFLKTQAPFWKKEDTPSGSRWVEARTSDDAALDRWRGA